MLIKLRSCLPHFIFVIGLTRNSLLLQSLLEDFPSGMSCKSKFLVSFFMSEVFCLISHTKWLIADLCVFQRSLHKIFVFFLLLVQNFSIPGTQKLDWRNSTVIHVRMCVSNVFLPIQSQFLKCSLRSLYSACDPRIKNFWLHDRSNFKIVILIPWISPFFLIFTSIFSYYVHFQFLFSSKSWNKRFMLLKMKEILPILKLCYNSDLEIKINVLVTYSKSLKSD